MESTLELAGFFAAHGIWCVLDGGPLIPILAFETADGKRQMHRLAAPELQRGVEMGLKWLVQNRDGAVRAALVYDGCVTLPSGKMDALLLEIRNYGPPLHSLQMAIPYRPASDNQKFAVFKPKFLSCDSPPPDYQVLGSAFFKGVDSHEKGAAVWNSHLDQSI